MGGKTRSYVHKLSNALHTGCLVEVAGRYCFPVLTVQRSQFFDMTEDTVHYSPNHIEVCSYGDDLHFLELHDVLQLRTHFARLP